MSKQTLLTSLRSSGIVAIIRTKSPKDLVAVSRALSEGGVRFVEITMTVPGACDIIRDAVVQLKDVEVFIGAGTVTDAATAEAVIAAGAKFVVGPGYDPEVVKLCNARDIVVMPGAVTPHEILTAWKGGADVVKIFPAKYFGGPDYIKAVREPLPQIELLPTNGIDFETAGAYLRAGSIAVGAGRALLSEAMIATGDYALITENAKRFSRIVREAREKML